jgi:hypothetical protein
LDWRLTAILEVQVALNNVNCAQAFKICFAGKGRGSG